MNRTPLAGPALGCAMGGTIAATPTRVAATGAEGYSSRPGEVSLRASSSLLCACAAALLASGAATAAPVVYPLASTSQVNGVLTATVDVDVDVVDEGVADVVSLRIAVIAPLSGVPEGSVTADWGSPGFAASLLAEPGALDAEAAGLGSGSGSAALAFGSSIQAQVQVDSLALYLESRYDAPLAPAYGAAGPWSGEAPADVALGAAIRWSVAGAGDVLVASGPIALDPTANEGWSLAVDLSRLGVTSGAPLGTASQLAISVADLAAALATQPMLSDDTIVCLFGVEPDCAYEVRGFTAQLSAVSLSGVGADLVGSAPAVVPEPAALLAGCAALLALALRRTR
jgi:hypothetical protein